MVTVIACTTVTALSTSIKINMPLKITAKCIFDKFIFLFNNLKLTKFTFNSLLNLFRWINHIFK